MNQTSLFSNHWAYGWRTRSGEGSSKLEARISNSEDLPITDQGLPITVYVADTPTRQHVLSYHRLPIIAYVADTPGERNSAKASHKEHKESQRGEAATKAGGAPWPPIKRDHKTLFENGEPVRQEKEPQIAQIAQIY
jgi:hypothetical protein